MSFKVVIPARFASSRLPGKPLADIKGKPMVQWVYERALLSSAQEIIIAVDDEKVEKVAQGFCDKVMMTPQDLPSGTDRLQYVAKQLNWADDDIVVNVQGDEPMLPAPLIDQVANNLKQRNEFAMATLYEPLSSSEDLSNPNVVKVVADKFGKALYFSRASIPWDREGFKPDIESALFANWHRHLGMYAYRVSMLHEYVGWGVAGIEQCEQLEQLRALYNGSQIHIEKACQQSQRGVDTQQDLDWVRENI